MRDATSDLSRVHRALWSHVTLRACMHACCTSQEGASADKHRFRVFWDDGDAPTWLKPSQLVLAYRQPMPQEIKPGMNCLALFEGLQAEMKGMFAQIDKHNKKWRVSKMLSSSTFKQDFDRAKTSVLELKSALHAFLDQEAQDAQEKKLAEVAQSAIEVAAKLDTMDAQLAEIREMLTAANQNDPTEAQLDEESLIYARLQQAADRTGDLPFKLFVPTFEMFFFDNGTLDKAQTRALKIALDRDNTGKVTKPYFIKFFRAWKESGMTMQAYMQKLADEAPPTLFAEGIANAEHLAEAASDKVSALLHSDKAVAAKAAAEKAAHDAKEGLKNIGGSLFGKKSPAKEPAAKEEAA